LCRKSELVELLKSKPHLLHEQPSIVGKIYYFEPPLEDVPEDVFDEAVLALRSKISAHSEELAAMLDDAVNEYLDAVFGNKIEAIDLCQMAADIYVRLSSIDPSIRMRYFEEFIERLISMNPENVERRIAATIECFRKEVIKRRMG
jgi:hypothetical protein